MSSHRRIVIETIGDLIREEYQLFGTCGECRTRKELDLVAMADEHGAECKPSAIAGRMLRLRTSRHRVQRDPYVVCLRSGHAALGCV